MVDWVGRIHTLALGEKPVLMCITLSLVSSTRLLDNNAHSPPPSSSSLCPPPSLPPPSLPPPSLPLSLPLILFAPPLVILPLFRPSSLSLPPSPAYSLTRTLSISSSFPPSLPPSPSCPLSLSCPSPTPLPLPCFYSLSPSFPLLTHERCKRACISVSSQYTTANQKRGQVFDGFEYFAECPHVVAD